MSDQIDKHNFEIAKQSIKSFAENLPADPKLKRVEQDVGPFGWLNHDVTGKELNELTSQIQDCLISNNQNIRKTIQEFKTIYDTLEYLDKDYLAGIVASVQAAEAASEATKRNTEDIQKNLDALTKLVGKLKDFKQETEENIISLQTQIDAVAKNLNARSNDIDSVRIYVRDLKDSINKANKKLSDVKSEIDKSLNSLEKNFLRCNGFIDKLRKQEHLHEIDLLWLSNQNLQMKVEKKDDEFATFVVKNAEMLSDVKSEIDKSLNSLEENFLQCNGFIDKLRKQEHLHEIDLLWLSNQNLQMKVEKKDDEFATFVAKNAEMFSEVRQNLDKLWNNHKKNDDQLAIFERKKKKLALRLNISYGIAIIAIVLSIYNLFV